MPGMNGKGGRGNAVTGISVVCSLVHADMQTCRHANMQTCRHAVLLVVCLFMHTGIHTAYMH